MLKILVSPVAFNEHIKLKNAVVRFLAARKNIFSPLDYLIVDDGSTDGTTAMIESFKDQGVKTIRHPQRSGVGAAIRTAIKYARDHQYDVLVIMAGNDKDNPEEIPRLLEPIIQHDYDLVQGSRYLDGGGTGGDMPSYRKFATRLHPRLFTFVTGHKMTDTTNGFRAFKLSIFKDERINIDQAWLNCYELEPYLLFKSIKLGYQVKEAPVTKIYPSKKLGYTKMRPLIGWWSILRPLVFLGLGIRK